jgi:hypothetical protein
MHGRMSVSIFIRECKLIQKQFNGLWLVVLYMLLMYLVIYLVFNFYIVRFCICGICYFNSGLVNSGRRIGSSDSKGNCGDS